MPFKLTIEIHGNTRLDLNQALEEIGAKVDDEYREGFDRKETANYEFRVEEE